MTNAAMATGGEFRIGPIFGRAWSVYMSNFVKFSVIALVIALPQLLTGDSHDAAASASVESSAWKLVAFIIGMILNTIGQAVILYGAFQVMRGRVMMLGEAARRGLSRFWSIIGLAILATLGIIVGTLLFIVPGIMLAIRWSVALPACVVENMGPLAAMRRSAQLTKGHRWKIFGVFILILIIVVIVAMVVFGVVAAVVGAITLATEGIAAVVLAGLLGLIGAAIYTAYLNIVLVMLYHDLRVAKEGVDTDQIAAVFD
jgi:uncharacterized membrane protein